MDARHFDRLARALSTAASRRGALATLLTGILTPLLPALSAERGKDKDKDRARGSGKHARSRRRRQQRRRGRTRAQAVPATCFGSGACTSSPGAYLAKCDFGGSNALENANCKGCNLTSANLRKADASGAKLTNANLSKVCLVDADLTGANFTGANTSGAIFCRTRMPNGSINNSGCSKGTKCCQTCTPLGESGCSLGGSCCGGGVCQNDTCVCPAGLLQCGSACVAPNTDLAHCGGCGRACGEGQTCRNGVCTCDGSRCAGCCHGTICLDGTSDAQCGAGGDACTACTGGRVCRDRTCVCPDGQDVCADACVDRQTAALHCGECGTTCEAGEACRDGACGCGSGGACGTGETCCAGTCRNLQTAFGNCGACGNACYIQTANTCSGGVCKCGSGPACPTGQTCCGGVCCDTGQCCNGVCCGAGQTCCNGVCRTLSTDYTNCGACGTACSSRTADRCVNGTCRCGSVSPCTSGFTCCSGLCRDLDNDPANCWACGNVCPGYFQQSTLVSCNDINGCVLECFGWSYDVNGDASDGCEALWSVYNLYENYTQNTAVNLGSFSCHDNSHGTFSGTILSDARHHVPLPTGFNPGTGSAPHWYKAFASGGACVNDPYITITMTWATSDCYRLTFISDKLQASEVVTNGLAVIDLGARSYSDDTDVCFVIEKICTRWDLPGEAAAYTVDFHL